MATWNEDDRWTLAKPVPADPSVDAASLLVDIRYAVKQLRRFRDIGRALDALDRVEETLRATPPDAPTATVDALRMPF